LHKSCSHLRGLLIAIAAAGTLVTTAVAQTAHDNLRVDWNDPLILQFRQNEAAGRTPPFFSAGESARVAKLRVPVLGFREIPQIARQVMGGNAKTTIARKIIFDAADPVWYHMIERFGDVTITVDADLRVNHAGTTLFQSQKPADRSKAARVSVLDGATEDGMEGVIAEYTVYRFPDIPFTVKIECTGASKAQCRNTGILEQDQVLLEIVAAAP
jgi:hypothetical protein